MPLIGSLKDGHGHRKKSVNLKKCQQKFPKLKCKEKENERDNIQKLWDNYKRYSIHIMRIPEGEGTAEIFEAIMTKTFPKLMTDTKDRWRKLRKHQAG